MHICVDGKIQPADQPVFRSDNKGYRYGDGLFETMKMVNGRIPLIDRHMRRLFAGLECLQFSMPGLFTPGLLEQEIGTLCEKNRCAALARVRLSVSRGDGGLHEQQNDRLHYLIECWPVSASVNEWNDNGLIIGLYPHARKSTDRFSSLKSANFLPYTMAARFAKQQQWNDCLILNTSGHLADSTIANIFLVKNNRLFTPAHTQGAVDGIMRNYLLESLKDAGHVVEESSLTVEHALEADELFLTNAMYGMRWVTRFGERSYTNQLALKIYRQLVQTIW